MERTRTARPPLVAELRRRFTALRPPDASIVVPTVVGMVVLRLVFLSFPVIDLVGRNDPAVVVGGGGALAVILIAQTVILVRVLRGQEMRARERVLATLEFACGLLAVLAFGQWWVATPVFGLVDVLICFQGRVRLGLMLAGVVTYLFAVARLYEPLILLAELAEFGLSVLVLYALLKLVINVRELHESRDEIGILVLARDRARVARDLHDTLGQRLSVALIKLDVADRARRSDPAKGDRELGEVRDLLREAAEDMQQTVTGLRVITLAGEIAGARSVMTAAGIEARTAVDDVEDESIARVLAWAVREGSTNVLKHSLASRCHIELDVRADHVELRLSNDGATEPPAAAVSGGHGIVGLRERVLDLGGTVETVTALGWHLLRVSIPIEHPA